MNQTYKTEFKIANEIMNIIEEKAKFEYGA